MRRGLWKILIMQDTGDSDRSSRSAASELRLAEMEKKTSKKTTDPALNHQTCDFTGKFSPQSTSFVFRQLTKNTALIARLQTVKGSLP